MPVSGRGCYFGSLVVRSKLFKNLGYFGASQLTGVSGLSNTFELHFGTRGRGVQIEHKSLCHFSHTFPLPQDSLRVRRSLSQRRGFGWPNKGSDDLEGMISGGEWRVHAPHTSPRSRIRILKAYSLYVYVGESDSLLTALSWLPPSIRLGSTV